MPAGRYIVALDQGTTSSRSLLFDGSGRQVAIAAEPLPVSFPSDGWVEQDPEQIWSTQLKTLEKVTQGINGADIACIGLTNQRETIVAWNRESGKPVAPAIVWQCRRSAEICARLRSEGLSEEIRRKTGLVLDPYFSGTKILWLMEQDESLKRGAEQGRIVFGTVDSWLIYKLTGGKRFVTEASNASRTMLCNLRTGKWDAELLRLFALTPANLPKILDSAAQFGETQIGGAAVPITGVLGDQQAALLGHRCLEPGMIKCTFGTGAFMLLNTGTAAEYSSSGLLSTIAWQTGSELSYALEGSVFVAGSVVQWLRDKLGILTDAAESAQLAAQVPDSGGVTLIPAFVGLGAPHWDSAARGAIFGMTRDTSRAHIIRAALEGVAHQVADITETPEFSRSTLLRIDGGMSVNSAFCQILSDLTGIKVEVAGNPEVTALGASLIAALGAGLFASLAEACNEIDRTSDKPQARYEPRLSTELRSAARRRWKLDIARIKSAD